MCGNMNRKPIGTCSQCGGVVSVPTMWHGVNRPVASCERCGATAKASGPVIETEGGRQPSYSVRKWGGLPEPKHHYEQREA